jgi:hypothetical protein
VLISATFSGMRLIGVVMAPGHRIWISSRFTEKEIFVHNDEQRIGFGTGEVEDRPASPRSGGSIELCLCGDDHCSSPPARGATAYPVRHHVPDIHMDIDH